jgi:hypothetical protein
VSADPDRSSAEVPHPPGAEVWERVTVSADGDEFITSWSFLWQMTDGETVPVPRDQLLNLLLLAGFECKGIADGTFASWRERELRDGQ